MEKLGKIVTFAISEERLIVGKRFTPQADHNVHISIVNFNIDYPRVTSVVKNSTYI